MAGGAGGAGGGAGDFWGRDATQFVTPTAVAVDKRDWIYVADSGTHRIQAAAARDITI